MREEKQRLAKMHQEERVRKAQERAAQPVRKHLGRRPVFRSQPPAVLRKQEGPDLAATQEEEEYTYFFTWAHSHSQPSHKQERNLKILIYFSIHGLYNSSFVSHLQETCIQDFHGPKLNRC